MYKFYIDGRGYPRWKDTNELVHRTVARKMVGGRIFPNCVVHHIDGDKLNFKRSNLRIMSRKNHFKLHVLKLNV